jgi:FkbM family methyltransferase
VTVLKETRHGRMLFLSSDSYIGRSLDLYGEYSEGEAVVFRQLMRPGDVAVEVGANIGVHTVTLAKLAGAAGLVIAFEPQRIIFQLLCANLALNGLINVIARHAAAGAEAGSINVPRLDYAMDNNFGGMALGHAEGGEPVPVVALDSLTLPSLRLLKIDVEGMERAVLSGARQTIARHRPILYVENDRRAHSAELIGMIGEQGYAMWWHAPPLFNPNNFRGHAENVFGAVVSINLLCTPKEMDVRMEGFRAVSGPADWWIAE